MKKKTDNSYKYTDSGLDYVYLLNGYEVYSHPEIGEGVAIHNLDGLHRAITNYILEEIPVLRGQEIRYLRGELKLSQKQLAILLRKDLRTIQRWEAKSDKNKPIEFIESDYLKVICKANLDGNDVVKEIRKTLVKLQDKMEAVEATATKIRRLELLDTRKGWHAEAA